MASTEAGSSKADDQLEPAKEPFRRQGSVRRVVHSDKDQPMIGVCAKMVERAASSQPYAPFIQEYCIISEFNMVGDHHIPGLYVIPSAKTAMIWFGVVFIRSGLYKGGVFKFNLLLPEGFPGSTSPRVIFEKDIFHPNIEFGTGELNLDVAFRDWRKDVNHIWQVLEYTRAIFYSIDTKSTVNSEALSMYITGNEEFDKRAKECAEESMKNVFEVPAIDDEHYLRFQEYQEEIHKEALLALTKPRQKDEEPLEPRCRGLSWVRKGSLQPFSKLVR